MSVIKIVTIACPSPDLCVHLRVFIHSHDRMYKAQWKRINPSPLDILLLHYYYFMIIIVKNFVV